MKKWIILAVLLVAGVIGYMLWAKWQGQLAQARENDRPTTAPVIQTNIEFAVNAAGEIGPAEQVSVRPEINGRIEALPVDLGDKVKQGDLLFKLDDKELQQQKASSLTSVERARLELEKSERDYKRAQELLTGKLISQEMYDDAKTAFELARNSLDRAQKDLLILDERLTKTEVRAPFDCTVLTRPVSVGQAVSGSGGFNSGTEVLTIADLNSMVINAHVNQADVPRTRVGQSVEVAIEAVNGLTATGVVERVAPQAMIRNNIKGFAARVLLKSVDQRVRPGMTANIKIPVASAANVLAVPLAAVFTERNPESSQMERFVYVQSGDGFEKRVVQIGVSDFFHAEVQGGLAPGDVVALELPKEEREKQAKTLAGARPGGGGAPVAASAGTNARPAGTPSTTPAAATKTAATGPATKAETTTGKTGTPATASGGSPATPGGSASAATGSGSGSGTATGGSGSGAGRGAAAGSR
jgi:RND family efflux transporter MFP subunit